MPNQMEGGGKELLIFQSEPIHYKDLSCQEQASKPSSQKSNAKERAAASPVHRSTCDIEWEPLYHFVHQDTEVIPKVRSRHAESPHARKDEDVPSGNKTISNQGLVNGRIEWLS